MKKYKTIVLSDIHLGSPNSQVKKANEFLRKHSAQTIILNGDIIDGWSMRGSGKWSQECTKFFRILLKKTYKENSKVIYIRGNHDDFLDQVLPFTFGDIFKVKKDHVIRSGDKTFYIVHGDIFDIVTTKLKWVSVVGDWGYTFLLWLNRKVNQYREKRGMPYRSFSKMAKSKVKAAVSFISDFEEQLTLVASKKGYDGIICGHIHEPIIKEMKGGKIYMNSGDFVENCSALVEDFDGNWKVIWA